MNTKTFQEHGIGKATAIIAGFSLLAKFLGLARDAVFSHQFGAGTLIDSYFAAFRVPDFIYNLLILGTFSVAFIPVFSDYLLKGKEEANKLASSIINTTLAVMLALTVLAYIFITPLTHAIAPGFTGQAYQYTKVFTQVFLLSPLFLTLSSIVSSMLNTYKRFALVSAAPVVYNLSIIGGALWLYPQWGPLGLAWGVAIGAFLHFAIQLPQLFSSGFRYEAVIRRADPGFRKFWKLYWPRIFSMGTEQVTALIVTIFGSFLGSGALAAFYYANNLQSVFLGIFAVSFAIAVFPLLSDLYNQKEEEKFKDVLAKTSVQILFFIVPLSVLLLVERAQAVRLVLGIGAATRFTFADTKIVAESLGLFCISLFAQALVPLFTRVFYARHNTMVPVVIGFATIAFNILLTFLLTRQFGIPGMALSYSITNILNLIILIFAVHHHIGGFHDEYLIVNSLKIVIASLLAAAAAFLGLYALVHAVNITTYVGVLIQGVAAGAAGIIVYLGASWILGISEAHHFIRVLKLATQKLGRPINMIWNWKL